MVKYPDINAFWQPYFSIGFQLDTSDSLIDNERRGHETIPAPIEEHLGPSGARFFSTSEATLWCLDDLL